MRQIRVKNFGRIHRLDIQFGDFTVLVGPQAAGKTLFLEIVKLVNDYSAIVANLKRSGFSWKDKREFLGLYFGEGLGSLWDEHTTEVVYGKKKFEIHSVRGRSKEKVFYIPAQRVLTLHGGWPRPFGEYSEGDPYVVRDFSEKLRRLMESGLGREKGKEEGSVFPQRGRINQHLRNVIAHNIFPGVELVRAQVGLRRKLVLKLKGQGSEKVNFTSVQLPFMVWSTGQREFVPLLLGLYWLLPSSGKKRKKDVQSVIVEEPEMGLHPQAVEGIMLIFLELLRRGYKVIISTHTPQFLEMIWAIKQIKIIAKNKSGKDKKKIEKSKKAALRKLFGVTGLSEIWEAALQKVYKVYYFEELPDGRIEARDISSLEVFEEDSSVSDWGGLVSFSNRASEVISSILE